MKILVRAVAGVVVVAGVIGLWFFLHPSPERLIRRQLDGVAAVMTFDGHESMITRATRAQAVASYFAPEVALHIDLPEVFSNEGIRRDEIVQLALGLRSSQFFRWLKITMLDPVITLGADGASASVDITVKAQTSEEKYFIVQEMKFTMRLEEGKWLIRRVETVKTLSQAPGPRAETRLALR